MTSNKQIMGLVIAFLSVWLTYQVTITMAQPAPNTGANTSGINMTASGSNMTSPNTGANTSGINMTASGSNMTSPNTGANTSGINMTSPNTGANTSGSGVNTTITKA